MNPEAKGITKPTDGVSVSRGKVMTAAEGRQDQVSRYLSRNEAGRAARRVNR